MYYMDTEEQFNFFSKLEQQSEKCEILTARRYQTLLQHQFIDFNFREEEEEK
jgi:hypothetical protein